MLVAGVHVRVRRLAQASGRLLKHASVTLRNPDRRLIAKLISHREFEPLDEYRSTKRTAQLPTADEIEKRYARE